ncbi:hypothetical protein CSKR_109538 [Clonorchis sinensis]|uniref:Uncharacterized protein n=1 Tax=Clonorchis sinensis TaxID=79923 RepID=A0A3R7C724_CLOSI|nr:hypothetical protein CSKR_109538 [Clonorchis sinensis]
MKLQPSALTGKEFVGPPDMPSSSWVGHNEYKGLKSRSACISKQNHAKDSVTGKRYLRVTRNIRTSGKAKQSQSWASIRYSSKTNGPLGLLKYKPNEQTVPHLRQSHVHKLGQKWLDDLKAK